MERETVTLYSTDTPLDRARKIWRLLGFANDRAGQVPMMAAYLGEYAILDQRAALALATAATPKEDTRDA